MTDKKQRLAWLLEIGEWIWEVVEWLLGIEAGGVGLTAKKYGYNWS